MSWRALPIAALVLLAGCAGGRLKAGEPRPVSPTVTDEAFQPHRQMADNGRLVPVLSRRCVDGMQPTFNPEDSEYVAVAWRATGEFVHFLVTVIPALLERRVAPAEGGERVTYVAAGEIDVPGTQLGGIIKLRDRKRKPKEIDVRQTLFTSDLWMRDDGTGTVVHFDGVIDYGAGTIDGLRSAPAAVNGWGQVHRQETGYPRYVVGTEVKNLTFLAQADRGVRLEGQLVDACAGTTDVVAELTYPSECPVTPATLIKSVEFRQGDRRFLLVQDEDVCDDCVWLTVNDAAVPEKFCPQSWIIEGEGFSLAAE